MSDNNILKHPELEKNQQLKLELEAAQELIKHYESLIATMQSDHRKSIHDLANPLQIVSMTLESLEGRVPQDLLPSIERMKRSTDSMTSIIATMRKLRSISEANKLNRVV